MKNVFVIAGVLFTISVFAFSSTQAWDLPPDKATVGKDVIDEIVKGNDFPEATTYAKEVFYLDFLSYGKKFTQVVIRLTPKNPLVQNGKKIILVAAEPGSEYGGDFLETVEGKDGMGPWMAKRGVTFIALTRVGRWNFLSGDDTGSWEKIPSDQRMPIFNRDQKTNWSPNDYTSKTISAGDTASSSDINRYPKEGTELYNQMLAATPVTLLKGYQYGLNLTIPQAERHESTVLYWGMSTGGAFLWPLAKLYKPDGYLGYGTSSTGLAYLYRRGTQGNFGNPYEKSFLQVRQRGTKDFDFYTKHIDDKNLKEAWWKMALKNPRFKSVEDPMMMFHIGALSEMATRLWMADFLPAEYKAGGFNKFLNDILEPCFPPDILKEIPALEINGTLDEVMPPKVVDAHRDVMEPHCKKYRVARIQDFHHYLFTQDMIKTVGSLWLRFIESGYYD